MYSFLNFIFLVIHFYCILSGNPHLESPEALGAVVRSQTGLGLYVCMLSHFSPVQLFAALWAVACQAPLSMGFSKQEYWSGLPCPPPGDLPDPGIELVSPALQADSFPSGKGLSAWGLLPPAAPAPHSCSLSFLQTTAS